MPDVMDVDAVEDSLLFGAEVVDAEVVVNVERVVGTDDVDEAVPDGGAALDDDKAPLSGAGALSMSKLSNTSSALICWPAPVVPSNPSTYHLVPQLELPSPTHDLAAACADACNHGAMVPLIRGAKTLDLASQRARKPLKANWSVSQVPASSHATSNMTLVALG